MTKSSRDGSRTLLLSVLMSAPGPLLLAIGLASGGSSTQMADFFRRSAELLALICALAVYRVTRTVADPARKKRLEQGANLFVGFVMCISGAVMVGLAVFTFGAEKGNVTTGLLIAALGLVANTLFCVKYTRLNRLSPNAILAVQARLYRVKAMVDACVTAVLTAVTLFPAAPVTRWLDGAGSAAVALYLGYCGAKTIKENTAPL